MKNLFAILAFAILIAAAGCDARQPKAKDRAKEPVPKFRAVFVPDKIRDPQKRTEYLREHFWDNIDPADTLFFQKIDTVQLFDAFLNYTMLLKTEDSLHVTAMMKKMSASKTALQYFAMLAHKVLYEPISPLRNDELYIPVLKAQLESPLLDEYEKLAPQELLELTMQNRPGCRANDFEYTLADGRHSTLYALKADFVLLYFHNPGCTMCRQVAASIAMSPYLSKAIADGRLKVLAVYPDEDLEAWRETLDEFPATWINVYDKGAVITHKHLYDLKAIPSLYLLDSHKRVLVKDGVDAAYIESVLADNSAS